MSWITRAYNTPACKFVHTCTFSKSAYDFYSDRNKQCPASLRVAKIIGEVVKFILTRTV